MIIGPIYIIRMAEANMYHSYFYPHALRRKSSFKRPPSEVASSMRWSRSFPSHARAIDAAFDSLYSFRASVVVLIREESWLELKEAGLAVLSSEWLIAAHNKHTAIRMKQNGDKASNREQTCSGLPNSISGVVQRCLSTTFRLSLGGVVWPKAGVVQRILTLASMQRRWWLHRAG